MIHDLPFFRAYAQLIEFELSNLIFVSSLSYPYSLQSSVMAQACLI